MDNDSIDPVEILQSLLNNLVTKSSSKEEIVKVWFYIGRMMGIERIFPEMQVIVTPDGKGVNQPILLVGSLHTLVVDYLTDEKIISEDLANLCLREIELMRKDEVIH